MFQKPSSQELWAGKLLKVEVDQWEEGRGPGLGLGQGFCGFYKQGEPGHTPPLPNISQSSSGGGRVSEGHGCLGHMESWSAMARVAMPKLGTKIAELPTFTRPRWPDAEPSGRTAVA